MHTSNNIIITQCPYMINYWITNNMVDGVIIKKNINITKTNKPNSNKK